MSPSGRFLCHLGKNLPPKAAWYRALGQVFPFESGEPAPSPLPRQCPLVLDLPDGLAPDAEHLAQLQLGHKRKIPQFLEAAGNFGFICWPHGPQFPSCGDYACSPFLTHRSPMKRGNFHGCG
jgi:hypothetical protein